MGRVTVELLVVSPMSSAPKPRLKILHVASEIAPHAKVGGLADVVSALTKTMPELGHETRAILPKYGFLEPNNNWEALPDPLAVHLGHGEVAIAQLWHVPHGKGTIVMVDYESHYGGDTVYWFNKDNCPRYAFLCRAVIDYCHKYQWFPDVIHCHDWHSGLVPVYLNTTEVPYRLHRSASLMTIHNMQHQGETDVATLTYANLPESCRHEAGLLQGGKLNMLKAGLTHATKLSTVSSNYAREIQTEPYGCGLDPLLRRRAQDLRGILNGIDTQTWNPATDPFLPANYNVDDLSGKARCKEALQTALGLEQNPTVPVFGTIARLFEQKGLDLLVEIMDGLMQDMAIQVAVLGSGDPKLETAFRDFASRYPGRIGCYIGYNAQLSHIVEAGSDFFLMPSRFEPCGLNQMYSMAYGTLPIVRETGGLADSVEQYDAQLNKGSGFLFREISGHALYHTIGWACQVYYDEPEAFLELRKRAMRQDLSWEHSAGLYHDLYLWAVDTRLRGLGYLAPNTPAPFTLPKIPAV